jgi:CubicO group peptidase (beta-lactamase class C family)
MATTPAEKSTFALYLPAEPNFWQFSPEAAPRKSVGALPLNGLRQLRSRLKRHVEPGFAPGVVGLVAHGPFVETVALGRMALDAGSDMRRDTIFRIGSQTKAVTAAAVMMLIEEGKVRLDEPVDRLLPELVTRPLLRRLDADVDDTVPANRPLTVEDLLTFRCGLGLVLAPPGRYPIQKAIADLGVFGPPDAAMPLDVDAWMRRIGSLPLVVQPGEDGLYGTGSNIQGVLVARASGQPLSLLLGRTHLWTAGDEGHCVHRTACQDRSADARLSQPERRARRL